MVECSLDLLRIAEYCRGTEPEIELLLICSAQMHVFLAFLGCRERHRKHSAMLEPVSFEGLDRLHFECCLLRW